MIEGMLESFTADGCFSGWLRDTEDALPVIVEVRAASGGAAVACGVAKVFRPDLLQGGHGHGHYGFRARLLSRLPAGRARFELFLPRHGQGVRAMLMVPDVALAAPVRVEELLRPEPRWTVADLLPALACLDLPGQLRALGPVRFIEAAYWFALRRWPGKGEAEAYGRALADGDASAEDVVRELLTSLERRDLGDELASPWDQDFPFAAGVGEGNGG